MGAAVHHGVAHPAAHRGVGHRCLLICDCCGGQRVHGGAAAELEVSELGAIPSRRWFAKDLASLPHWIAYWTYGMPVAVTESQTGESLSFTNVGFEMTVQWYFRRIRKTIANIAHTMVDALPANRKIISDFVSSREVFMVEDCLSGLRDIYQWEYVDWDSNVLFLKFKDYVVENEQRMERNLQSFQYCIDEANTLNIVAGNERPEKVSMFCASNWVM